MRAEWDWDDIWTLLSNRGMPGGEAARELIPRYLEFVERMTVRLTWPLLALVACFIACAAFNVQVPWLYETLSLVIFAILAIMVAIGAPLRWLSQDIYNVLPVGLQHALRAGLHSSGKVVFAGLLSFPLIRGLQPGQSLEATLTILVILALLWFGSLYGWVRFPSPQRRVTAISLHITLIVVAVAVVFPGPGELVGELAAWAGEKVKAAVYAVTRPTPERYYPASADELETAFRHQGTGEFLLWYSRGEQGAYRFYKSKGYDRFGRLKRADTQEEFQAILASQRARDAEREMARQRARQEVMADFEQRITRARDILAESDFDGAEREAREASEVLRQNRASLEENEFKQRDRAAAALLDDIRTARDEQARQRVRVRFEECLTRAGNLLGKGDFDGAESEAREAGDVLAQSRALLDENDFGQMDRHASKLLADIGAARDEHDKAERRRLRLASYVSALPTERVNYIVFCVDPAGKPSSESTSAVVNRLASRGITAAGEVLSDAFISPEGFDAVAAGKAAADVVEMGLGRVADRLLLIRGCDVNSLPSSTVSGLHTYTMRMTISLIDASDGRKLREFVISDVTGAGLTEAAAKSAFIERFAESLVACTELPAGLP